MNVIWTCYIGHAAIIMQPTTWLLCVSCVTWLTFTNPLPWPQGIVKCPLYSQFRIHRK